LEQVFKLSSLLNHSASTSNKNLPANDGSLLGWHGLAAAKTYLEVNPTAKLVILEDASTVGGVWAKHRLYPGLKSNNLLGTYQFSDFPVDQDKYNVSHGRPLPADIVHQYLMDYATHFGIYERIRFNSKVGSCEHEDGGGWSINIKLSEPNSTKTTQIVASKLIVATGLTSNPFLPIIKGSESFEPPVFHSKDFKENAWTLEAAKSVGYHPTSIYPGNADGVLQVCVLGGTKSAWDIVYAYATSELEFCNPQKPCNLQGQK